MALLSEGSSVKESPEDKQASAPCVRGSTLMWGPTFSVKSGLVPGISGGSEYSVTLEPSAATASLNMLTSSSASVSVPW